MKCDHKIRSIPSRWITIISTLPTLTHSAKSWRRSLEGKAHHKYIHPMTLDVVESREKYIVDTDKQKRYSITKLRGISELGNFNKSGIRLSERRYINEMPTDNAYTSL